MLLVVKLGDNFANPGQRGQNALFQNNNHPSSSGPYLPLVGLWVCGFQCSNSTQSTQKKAP
ncbi:hypothetical protein HHE01_10940 [Helicobacter heilmannii]|uniref:Uncharacterized protein n=1 Tax=Helicobacter heilmannii TaxID=35817 RepID=A0A0K2Y5Y8_HELHE|nr:hypothetical protein HHE01_10940 [Helicobacter heilmannii]